MYVDDYQLNKKQSIESQIEVEVKGKTRIDFFNVYRNCYNICIVHTNWTINVKPFNFL